MADLKEIDVTALIKLKGARPKLTPQQYRTLRGSILSGDSVGAMKGLKKVLCARK